METELNLSVMDDLIRLWRSENLDLNPAADDVTIESFERKHGVKLPAAFRYLYYRANGMDSGSMDSRLFSFWSLGKIQEKNGILKDGEQTRICFGDFLIDSHRYYLVLDSNGQESIFTDEINETVADSFADFALSLLTNPRKVELMPLEA